MEHITHWRYIVSTVWWFSTGLTPTQRSALIIYWVRSGGFRNKALSGRQIFFFIAVLCPDLRAELELDWSKGTRGGVKRVLFLDTQQPQRTGLLRLGHSRPRSCLSYTIYLKVNKSPVCTLGQALMTELLREKLWLPRRNRLYLPWEEKKKLIGVALFVCVYRRRMSSGTNWRPSHWLWTTAWLHRHVTKRSHLFSTSTAAPSFKSRWIYVLSSVTF